MQQRNCIGPSCAAIAACTSPHIKARSFGAQAPFSPAPSSVGSFGACSIFKKLLRLGRLGSTPKPASKQRKTDASSPSPATSQVGLNPKALAL